MKNVKLKLFAAFFIGLTSMMISQASNAQSDYRRGNYYHQDDVYQQHSHQSRNHYHEDNHGYRRGRIHHRRIPPRACIAPPPARVRHRLALREARRHFCDMGYASHRGCNSRCR